LYYQLSELIAAPISCLAGRAGVKELTSAEIFQELIYICSIHSSITVEVTCTLIVVGTWIVKRASPKVIEERYHIIGIHSSTAIKITFTLTGIPYAIASRGVGILLA
jgi:hypothetical protein